MSPIITTDDADNFGMFRQWINTPAGAVWAIFMGVVAGIVIAGILGVA